MMRILFYSGEDPLSLEIRTALDGGDHVFAELDGEVGEDTDVLVLPPMEEEMVLSIWERLDPSISLLAATDRPFTLAQYTGSGNLFLIPEHHTSLELRTALESIRHHRDIEKSLEKHVLGHSNDTKRLRSQIAFSALSPLPAHLYGETGTGKTYSARLIHSFSGNRKKMAYVNCSNLNSSIIDSDLFGHTKGAYTSSCSDRKGLLGQADDNTLFLDEVGDLSLETQGKLLDTIENGTYRRMGSDTEDKASFRLITAAQKSLEELLEEKKLRKDFYFRIKNVSIHMAPLREHKEDIPDFIKDFELKHNIPESRIQDYTPLLEQNWDGNVRELIHFMERVYRI